MGRTLDPTTFPVLAYLALLINGLILTTAFHIAVLSFAILTLEIDHTIMIYRDLLSLGRLPVDIYKQPIKGILTLLLPVGIMITLPAKALMGLITGYGALLSFGLGFGAIFLSLKFWDFALRRYTSASS